MIDIIGRDMQSGFIDTIPILVEIRVSDREKSCRGKTPRQQFATNGEGIERSRLEVSHEPHVVGDHRNPRNTTIIQNNSSRKVTGSIPV